MWKSGKVLRKVTGREKDRTWPVPMPASSSLCKSMSLVSLGSEEVTQLTIIGDSRNGGWGSYFMELLIIQCFHLMRAY